MTTTYCVIGKIENIVRSFNTTEEVMDFMLGRRVTEYTIVKSDDGGNRRIDFVGELEYSSLVNQLELG